VPCSQCGRVVEAGASFCLACGTLVAAIPAVAQAPAVAGHGMDREHWLLVLALNWVTLGLYGAHWWWSRADAFDRLRSARKFGNRAIFLILLLAPVGTLLQFVAIFGAVSGLPLDPATPPRLEGAYLAGAILALMAAIASILFAFIARRKLLDHYHSQGKADIRLSPVWTFLFNILYLQYRLQALP
jgi:uncharacterized protein DUF4234